LVGVVSATPIFVAYIFPFGRGTPRVLLDLSTMVINHYWDDPPSMGLHPQKTNSHFASENELLRARKENIEN